MKSKGGKKLLTLGKSGILLSNEVEKCWLDPRFWRLSRLSCSEFNSLDINSTFSRDGKVFYPLGTWEFFNKKMKTKLTLLKSQSKTSWEVFLHLVGNIFQFYILDDFSLIFGEKSLIWRSIKVMNKLRKIDCDDNFFGES